MYFNKLGTTEYNGTTIPDILKRITLVGDVATSNLVDQYTIPEGETPESLSFLYYGVVDYYWTILLSNNIKSRYFDWPMSSQELSQYITSKYGNKSALFFTEQILNNFIPLCDAKYVKTVNSKIYSVLECDRNLNKLVIEKITETQIAANDTIILLDKNKKDLFSISPTRVVYENEYSVHHVTDQAIENYNEAAPIRQYLNQYLNGQGGEFIISNYDYEVQENENKRSIFLIRPQYISQFVNTFKSLATAD